jgi:UDP-N-acetylmuramoylalanine--D-glutamate ligase
VVAITGTNGKSTTTALLHHICKSAGLPSRMGGNIGLPILGQEPLPAGGLYVLELSSYQIDLTRSLAADIAVLINLSPDHLDRYDGFAGYAASKTRLFGMQRPSQQAIFGCGDPHTLAIAHDIAAQRGEALVDVVDPLALTGQAGWPSLQGPHNLQNAAIAVRAAERLGIAEAQWRPALATFGGLPHRMERVAEHRGVLFVNDSKATNPASTAPALAAWPPAPGGAPRVHWILGGLPKGDTLDECMDQLGNIAAAYTIGEAGPRFAALLEPHVPVRRSEMLCEALRQAMAAARPGDVVLLSPACASFDQFRDFEARGDAFRNIVAALIEDQDAPCPSLREAAQ